MNQEIIMEEVNELISNSEWTIDEYDEKGDYVYVVIRKKLNDA